MLHRHNPQDTNPQPHNYEALRSTTELPDTLSFQAPFIPTVRDVRATEPLQAFLWFTSLRRHLRGPI